MHVVIITAKRQATLPAALCKELGLAPGAKVAVERRLVGKETVWVLKGSIARGWASGHRAT